MEEEHVSEPEARHIAELDLLMQRRFAENADTMGKKIESAVDSAVQKVAKVIMSKVDSKLETQRKDTAQSLGSLDNRISGAISSAQTMEKQLLSTLGQFRRELEKAKELDPKLLTDDTKLYLKEAQEAVKELRAMKKAIDEQEKGPLEQLLAKEIRKLREEILVKEDQGEAHKCTSFGWGSLPHSVRMKVVAEFQKAVPEREKILKGFTPESREGVIAGVTIFSFGSVYARQKFVEKLRDAKGGLKTKEGEQERKIGARACQGRTTSAINRLLISTTKQIQKVLGYNDEDSRQKIKIGWRDRTVAVEGMVVATVHVDQSIEFSDEKYEPKQQSKQGKRKEDGGAKGSSSSSSSSSSGSTKKKKQ